LELFRFGIEHSDAVATVLAKPEAILRNVKGLLSSVACCSVNVRFGSKADMCSAQADVR
jgi:hypothetical protein